MSYDTLTLFIDAKNQKVIPCGLACNFPSGLLSLAWEYQKFLREQDWENFDWAPEADKDLEGLFQDGVLDLDKVHVDAICVATIDHENPMVTSIAGTTYNTCSCGCHPLGDIREKLFPQNCTMIRVFERRLRDYFGQARRIKERRLLHFFPQ